MNKPEIKSLDLGLCIDKIIDNRGKTPKKLNGDWSENGVRVFSAKNIKNGKIVREKDIRYIDNEMYARWMSDEVEKFDIILTSEAPLGEIYFHDSDEKIVLGQRLYGIRANSEVVDPKYLYYYMRSSYFKRELDKRKSGTTVFGIRQAELFKTKVLLKDMEEQKRIGELLYNIEKKIDLNNESNKDLEDLAQKIFVRWFSKNYNHCENVELQEICDLITDGSHSSPKTVDDGYPMASVKDMNYYNISLKTCRQISKEDFEELEKGNCKPKVNDILIAKDGSYLKHVIKIKENIDVVILSSIAILRPNLSKIHPSILKRYLLLDSTKEALENGYVTGTAIKRIVLKNFRRFSLPLPTLQIQEEISSVLNEIDNIIYNNVKENEELEELLSMLTQHLVSGSMTVE